MSPLGNVGRVALYLVC